MNTIGKTPIIQLDEESGKRFRAMMERDQGQRVGLGDKGIPDGVVYEYESGKGKGKKEGAGDA